MKRYLRKLRTVLTVWSLLTLIVGQAGLESLPFASQGFGLRAQAQEANEEQQTPPPKVVICHATGSASNPFVRTVVSVSAINAHFNDTNDNSSQKAGHGSDLLFQDENAQCPAGELPSIQGTKWNDLNGNGEKDAGEPGVANVTISLNPQGDLQTSTTTTDGNGNYTFAEISDGAYDICEVVPTGWHQTYPINGNNNCHYVIFGNNNNASVSGSLSYDFGNQINPPIEETTCGNQIKETGEQCDDGNDINDDGCSSQCQLETPTCTEQQTGWWSEYFNLPSNHPDVGSFNIPYFPYDDNVHGDPLGGWAPWTADWYDSQYYRFSRVDSDLNFGDDFFPMDMLGEEVNPAWNNHDFFFAVHSRAKVTAPASTTYAYSLTSDDDSWVYIDGVRFDDKDGIHAPSTSGITQMPLTAGDHIIDVYYAERHPLGATLTVILDDRLTVMPAPKDCDNTCYSPLNYNDGQGHSGPDRQLTQGDAVEFTTRYEAALGKHTGDVGFDVGVDVKIDGVINAADYLCAQPYYGNAGPYSCQLDCNNICLNPLDYNSDYEIDPSDAVTFNTYYSSQDLKADLNGNERVDYGDYLCANDQQVLSAYQCPIQCAPVCGDGTIQQRLQEQCDDGNNVAGDGCSASCQLEQNGGPSCGNNIVEAGEQCDDGNVNNNDSCSNECTNNSQSPVPPVAPASGAC